MRILMLSWEYPPHIVGGMGRHVTELSTALVGLGVEVHVVTPHLRGGLPLDQTPSGVWVHRVATPPMEGYDYVAFVQQCNAAMAQAARALSDATGAFDLVHAHDWLAAGAASLLKQSWRRPLVATIHATERGRQQGNLSSGHSDQINNLEWWLTYEAWRVIVCSHFMSTQIQAYFNTPEDKIDVVANGVHIYPSPFHSAAERRLFKSRFVADGNPLVFYVGRIVYEKGLHLLIDAWPHILEIYPAARLVIAGTGDQLERMKQRAWDLHISDSIIFTGFLSDDDRDKLYRVADLAVFPSLYEPFGIVALEAMAAGCPVVVASTGGLAEVVRLHETGTTVYPNDVESLVWGIRHTLEHADWAQARVVRALEEVGTHYAWSQIAAATLAVYQHTLADWTKNRWGAELAPRH